MTMSKECINTTLEELNLPYYDNTIPIHYYRHKNEENFDVVAVEIIKIAFPKHVLV